MKKMNMKNMLPLAVGLILAFASSTLQAQTVFTDDFDRPDASNLGSNYDYYNALASSSSIFDILSNSAVSASNGISNGMAIVNASAFSIPASEAFNLSIQLQSDSTESNWAGLVFNFQDATNFNYIRWKSSTGDVQFISYSGGTIAAFKSSNDPNFNTTSTIQMALSSDGQGNYTATLSRAGVSDFAIDWADTHYTDGLVGLYYTGAGLGGSQWTFDNFSATAAVPEPNSAALLLGSTVVAGFLLRNRK